MSSGGVFPHSYPNVGAAASERQRQQQRTCRYQLRHVLLGIAMIGIVLGVTLGLGLGVGLARNVHHNNPASSIVPSALPSNFNFTSFRELSNTNSSGSTAVGTTWWIPSPGLSWQIQVAHSLNDISANVSMYDIDLFLNDEGIMARLHADERKVICYFSAGSYKVSITDAAEFLPSDFGSPVVGRPGEWWLNTTSKNVRRIMMQRLDLALNKNCDGVDPDNIDGFKHDSSSNLTQADAIDYITLLADAAHARNLSIGLRNGGDIVKSVVDKVDYAVNEECAKYGECSLFQPFITTNKPVFHIEYATSNFNINATASTDAMATICGHEQAANFSTILKNMYLDDWSVVC